MKDSNAFIGFLFKDGQVCAFVVEAPETILDYDFLTPVVSVENLALAQITADKLNETFEAAEIIYT